jgi:hypothetical protein
VSLPQPIDFAELAAELSGYGLTVVLDYTTPLTSIKIPLLLPDLNVALFAIPPNLVDSYSLKLTLPSTDLVVVASEGNSVGLSPSGLKRLLSFSKLKHLAQQAGV